MMKLAGLVMLGVLPGAAVAYAALTGYILSRVRPAPITVIPLHGVPEGERAAEPAAA